MTEKDISLFDCILIFGIVQSLICFIFLHLSQNYGRSNKIIAWFLLSLGLILVKMLIHSLGLWENSFFTYFPLSVELFPAPLFYLYVLSLETKPNESISGLNYYLIPGWLFLVHSSVVYFLCLGKIDLEEKRVIAENLFYNPVNQIEDLLAVAFISVFTFLSVKKLRLYQKKLYDYASDDYVSKVKWLIMLFISLSLLALISAIVLLLNQFFTFGIENFWHEILHHSSITAFLYFASIFVFGKNHLIPLQKIKKDVKLSDSTEIKDLSHEFSVVERSMVEKKYFLDPNLSLPNLSTSLGIKSYILSQSIKQHKSMSFRDYINHYRVEMAVKKLESHANPTLTILGIAYECGFNSEASFYRAFKKVTGRSPKSYLRKK